MSANDINTPAAGAANAGTTNTDAVNTSVTAPCTPPHATHGTQINSDFVPAAPGRLNLGR
jgi:hypothetical protein